MLMLEPFMITMRLTDGNRLEGTQSRTGKQLLAPGIAERVIYSKTMKGKHHHQLVEVELSRQRYSKQQSITIKKQ